MRTIRRWLPLLLVGLPPRRGSFGGHCGHGSLGREQHVLHGLPSARKKFTEFHPVQDKRVTLAAAHNLEGEKNVKCIDCHIGATVKDKMVIKALAARDTVAYFVGAFQEPTHLRYALGTRTCLKCHPTGGQNPEQENAFHNASHHTKMPIVCYECHTVHPTASVETRFLREPTVKPLCDVP